LWWWWWCRAGKKSSGAFGCFSRHTIVLQDSLARQPRAMAENGATRKEEEEEAGTVLWAKIAGYAMWPARIAKLSEVAASVVSSKRGNSQRLVYFFGSHDYAWVSQIQGWKDNYDKYAKGSKAKAFLKALKEAKQWLSAHKHNFPVHQSSSSPATTQVLEFFCVVTSNNATTVIDMCAG